MNTLVSHVFGELSTAVEALVTKSQERAEEQMQLKEEEFAAMLQEFAPADDSVNFGYDDSGENFCEQKEMDEIDEWVLLGTPDEEEGLEAERLRTSLAMEKVKRLEESKVATDQLITQLQDKLTGPKICKRFAPMRPFEPVMQILQVPELGEKSDAEVTVVRITCESNIKAILTI